MANIAAQIAAIQSRAERDEIQIIAMFEEPNVAGRKLHPPVRRHVD
ncbi:hypothetical protein [Sphingomonas sp. R86521]